VKTRFLIAILVTACIAGLRPEAHAEDNSIRVQMTHEFSVGKTTLPAGDYTIQRVTPGCFNVLLIRSEKSARVGIRQFRGALQSDVGNKRLLI